MTVGERDEDTVRERRVLVVEDDDDIREAIMDILECRGCTVQDAANGELALRCLRGDAQHPDVILLDLMMPVMDGWMFRAEQSNDTGIANIPVIVISAHADARMAAAELGASGWLRKPLDLSELLSAVGCEVS